MISSNGLERKFENFLKDYAKNKFNISNESTDSGGVAKA